MRAVIAAHPSRSTPTVLALVVLFVLAGCRLEIDLRTAGAPGGKPVDGPIVEVVDDEVKLVADDPLADGGRAAWLFMHGGFVWAGPNAAGTGAVRFTPEGDFVDRVRFEIAADDVAPYRSRNTSGSPYSSFGAPGCEPNTPACGPDNDDGAVLMGSVVLDGEEVVIAAGGRSGGDQAHVYLGRIDGDVVRFRPLDITAVSDRHTLGLSSISMVGGRVLLGLPHRGNDGPRLLELLRAPPLGQSGAFEARLSRSCNPSEGDICDLEAGDMPGLDDDDRRGDRVKAIDAVLQVDVPLPGAEGRTTETYVATPDGISRCEGSLAPATLAPGAWRTSTPSSPRFTDVEPVRSDATSATPLRDRAVPGFASAGGAVVFGRNSVDGPQLWLCNQLACGRDQWTVVPDLAFAGERLSIVQTVASTMMVGVDSPDGARVLQSRDGATWRALVDEEELLGDRLISALAMPGATDTRLWVLTADEEGPPRLVRLLVPTP